MFANAVAHAHPNYMRGSSPSPSPFTVEFPISLNSVVICRYIEVSIYQHFSKSVWVKFPGFRSGSNTCHTCNMTDDEKQTSSVRVGDLEHVTN